MRPDDYTAGVELFQATGSLIARPQRIVPVIVPPATLLWVPTAPLIEEGVEIGYSWTAYEGIDRADVWPEVAALHFMNDHYFETMPSRPGREPERRPPPLPEWFPPASPDVGQIPERYVGSRIRFSYPSPEMDAAAHRFEAAMAAPDVGPVPPGTVVRYDAPQRPVWSFAERICAIALDWLAARSERDPPNYVLDEDLVATLLDFARAGDEPAFRELALMRGVPAAEIGAMWDGTVKRVGKK